jgi:uncharacterized protein involved in exopolysaccharide biosynthesis/Mrp family chromosome partitioning ATPase
MNSESSVNETNGHPPAAGITVDDFCFTLFRHKWLILGFFCVGLAAAAFVRIFRPPKYASRAELMVKFVVDRQVASPISGDGPKLLTENSQNIITTELEMLRSLDVATNAAALLSPEIMVRMGVGTNRMAASGVVQSGIDAENPRGTSILALTYRHRDQNIVQAVLEAIITAYKIKHNQVYGMGNVDSFAVQELESSRAQLAATEEAYKQLTASNHLVSVEDTKRTYQTQIEKCQERLSELEADLARRTAMLGTAASSATNAGEAPVPREKLTEYTELVSQLENLKRNKQALRLQYTDAWPTVINVQARIDQANKEKAELENQFPALARMTLTPSLGGTNSAESELSILLGIKGEVLWRTTFLSNLQWQAQSLMELEPKLNELRRLRNLQETNYNNWSKIINDSMLTRALPAGSMVNMSEVQHATPAWRDIKKFMKLAIGAFGACFVCGLGVAFLLDFVVNRTINRGADAERHLRLPVLLSIPDFSWNRNGKRLTSGMNESGEAFESGGAVALWDPRSSHIEMYADGLRERLMTYLESRNLNLKKPKLVAVTECGEGAGVTVIANNLAASLSRTAGNVLLVDMKGENGAARAFFQGRPGNAVSNLLEPEIGNGENADANPAEQDNGEENNNKLACALPNKFNHIVPKLRASDYDYIVFDMPAITPMSSTPRLGSYMDIVLLVLESEKTGQQLAARATALMRETRANVAAVVNKYRAHVPARLSQEL